MKKRDKVILISISLIVIIIATFLLFIFNSNKLNLSPGEFSSRGLPESILPVTAYSYLSSDIGRSHLWTADGKIFIFNPNSYQWFDRTSSVKSGTTGNLPTNFRAVSGYNLQNKEIHLWDLSGKLYSYNIKQSIWTDKTIEQRNKGLPSSFIPLRGTYNIQKSIPKDREGNPKPVDPIEVEQISMWNKNGKKFNYIFSGEIWIEDTINAGVPKGLAPQAAYFNSKTEKTYLWFTKSQSELYESNLQGSYSKINVNGINEEEVILTGYYDEIIEGIVVMTVQGNIYTSENGIDFKKLDKNRISGKYLEVTFAVNQEFYECKGIEEKEYNSVAVFLEDGTINENEKFSATILDNLDNKIYEYTFNFDSEKDLIFPPEECFSANGFIESDECIIGPEIKPIFPCFKTAKEIIIKNSTETFCNINIEDYCNE